MPVQIDTTAESNGVRLIQQTVHPSSPSSGHELLYIVSGTAHGGVFVKDSAGRQIGPFITGTANVGGTGALVLLETHDASNSTSLDFVSFVSATYDEYLIELVNLVPASSALLYMRMSTDGGVSFFTTGSYAWAGSRFASDGSANAGSNPSSAVQQIQLEGNTNISTNTNYGISGTIRLYSPSSTALFKTILAETRYLDTQATPHLLNSFTNGVFLNTSAVNAVRFLFSTGNISTGSIRIYGIAKS